MLDAYIFDIDGTLANLNGRDPFDLEKCGEDLVNEDIKKIYEILRYSNESPRIIIVTWREDKYCDVTKEWLDSNWIWYYHLFMRLEWDKRPDTEVKKEIYENCIKDYYNVIWVFEDRSKVVKMYRELWLTVFQVAEGNY